MVELAVDRKGYSKPPVDFMVGPAQVSRVVELAVDRKGYFIPPVDFMVGPAQVSRVVDDENEAVQPLM